MREKHTSRKLRVALLQGSFTVGALQPARLAMREKHTSRKLRVALLQDSFIVGALQPARLAMREKHTSRKLRVALLQDSFTVGALQPARLAMREKGQSPDFRLASINWSRSPSRTACVLRVSTLVRRSLIRASSRTYERIWLPQPISALLSSSA